MVLLEEQYQLSCGSDVVESLDGLCDRHVAAELSLETFVVQYRRCAGVALNASRLDIPLAFTATRTESLLIVLVWSSWG